MTPPKLTIELVPSTCWFSNLRSAMTRPKWDALRKEQYKLQPVCSVCGGVGKQHPVECHEIWEYDDKKHVQTLKGLTSLCPSCHAVKHIGFQSVRGGSYLRDAINHIQKVNGWSPLEAKNYIDESFKIWNQRSAFEWKVDVSWLTTKGIDVDSLKWSR